MKISVKRIKEIIKEEMYLAEEEKELIEGEFADAVIKAASEDAQKIEPEAMKILQNTNDAVKALAGGDTSKANQYKNYLVGVLTKMEIK